jgi:hypothetical protein
VQKEVDKENIRPKTPLQTEEFRNQRLCRISFRNIGRINEDAKTGADVKAFSGDEYSICYVYSDGNILAAEAHAMYGT